MDIEKIELFPLKEKVKNTDTLYAHTKEKQIKKELLEEHLKKTLQYFLFIHKEKHLEIVWEKIIKSLDMQEEEEKKFFYKLLIHTFYLHDIGKMNTGFQSQVMNNELYAEGRMSSDTTHSMISSVIYIDYFFYKIRETKLSKEAKKRLYECMLLNAYCIARHHGNLKRLEDLKGSLLKELENYRPDNTKYKLYTKNLQINEKMIERIFNVVNKNKCQKAKEWDGAYPYIYSKLVYSLLVASDFYATTDYMNDRVIDELGLIETVDQWKKAYHQNDTYHKIMQYEKERKVREIALEKETNINVLRSEMFLEARQNLRENKDKNIFYLEAPTGSGKTNTSIELALTLLEEKQKGKLFYVFPFNTLVEQTHESLIKAFEKEDIIKQITIVNSLTPIVVENEKEETREENIYNSALLDRQFLHYPAVITSHVQLFRLLFGEGKEDGMPLYQLANSVIVLDEIQSYKNIIWKEMISFLDAYSKALNIKIIIMSATLPRLEELLDRKDLMIALLQHPEKYFLHPCFKNRVRLNFDLLKEEDTYEALKQKVITFGKKDDTNVLIEFINKKTAMKFYEEMVELAENGVIEKTVIVLTGDDHKWDRKKYIHQVKKEKNILLIATQLIEAGVDIDMDVGFKDISLLDAEEQFLGRINRSCKDAKGKTAYFFNLDNAKTLYKKDYRKNNEYTLLHPAMQEILEEKRFTQYYELIMDRIKQGNKESNQNNIEDFKQEALLSLDYKKVKEHMKLIDEENVITVFLGVELIVEIDGKEEKKDGKKVWQQYEDLLQDKEMQYARKKIELSKLREEIACFTWTLRTWRNFSYTKKIGDLYYIEEGEKYFTNGKFDRSKFNEDDFEFL